MAASSLGGCVEGRLAEGCGDCFPCAGVPVPLKRLDGVDSLYSILQMPKGVR